MPDKRIIEKIKALLEGAGRTEAEAMAALEQASRLMEKHGLTLDQIEASKPEDITQVFVRAGYRRAGGFRGRSATEQVVFHEVEYLTRAIAALTETKVWKQERVAGNFDAPPVMVYMGFEGDVIFAEYLTDMLRKSMEREWVDYIRSPERPKGKPAHFRKSFMMGYVHRVNGRIDQMVKEKQSRAPKTSTGTELVAVKQNMIAARMNQMGIHLGKASGRRFNYSLDHAYHSGRDAGDRVQFNKPLNGGKGVLGIGRK